MIVGIVLSGYMVLYTSKKEQDMDNEFIEKECSFMILDQKRISFNERSTNITDVTPVSGCNEVSSLCIVNPPQ